MFALKMILLIAVLFAITALSRMILIKIFNIKPSKKKAFSYNHINNLHRNLDWAIRVLSFMAYIVALYFMIYRDYSINFLLVVLLIIILVDNSTRAFIEWKYSENPKQSILTISDMFIVGLAIIIQIQFDLFNLIL